MNSDEFARRQAEYEDEVSTLQQQAKVLEEEVIDLRRKLLDAPKRVRTLEERLLEAKGQLAQAVSQNEKLSYTLREARDHIASLREEVEKLTQPPSAYGVVVGKNDDGTVDVLASGRKMRVSLHPEIDHDELLRGQEVVLNESFNIILARTPEVAGEIVTVKDLLEDGVRAVVVGRADEERVCELADGLRGQRLRPGDTILMDTRSGLLLEKLPRPEVEDLLLEEVPAAGVCRACGSESEWSAFPLACTACGGLEVDVVRGEELLVDALTMASNAQPGIGPGRRSQEGVPSGWS